MSQTGISGETKNGTTYLFPTIEGESQEQIQAKIDSGYVELPQFAGHADMQHFDCASCEYFKTDLASPTKYRCSKYGFFDVDSACCSGWELKPEYRKYRPQEAWYNGNKHPQDALS